MPNAPSAFSQQMKVAQAAASTAATILRNHFEAGVSAAVKSANGQEQGLVTVADLETEKAIIDTIRATFPDHAFLAEESASSGNNRDHLWIIDPLDGTNNFAFGIPHFATSIAYWHCGEPVVAVVVDPIKNESFVAEKGQGATLNGDAIHVSHYASLREAIVGTGFYYDRGSMMQQTLRSIETLFQNDIRGLRRMGAASLDIAYVACGRFGAFFELTLSPWDFAAACLILTEAGGRFSDCSGNKITATQSSVLATNGHIHESILDLL